MEEKPIEQKESIKLTKNAKGEYQWEIKLIEIRINSETTCNRLENINESLEKRFKK